MRKKFLFIPVVILKTRTGYNAFCPVIDGCTVTDKTIDQTLCRMRDALEFHIEGLVLTKKLKSRKMATVLKKSFDDYGTDAFYATLKVAA